MSEPPSPLEVVSTSRGRVVTGPVSKEHEELRRRRVRKSLIAALIAVAVFLSAGAYGLVRSTSNPDSPYNQPKNEQSKDPFGF